MLISLIKFPSPLARWMIGAVDLEIIDDLEGHQVPSQFFLRAEFLSADWARSFFTFIPATLHPGDYTSLAEDVLAFHVHDWVDENFEA